MKEEEEGGVWHTQPTISKVGEGARNIAKSGHNRQDNI